MRKILFLLSLSLCFPVCSQTLHLSGSCKDADFLNMKLYAKPINNMSQEATVALTITGSNFAGDVPVASDGFYHLYAINERRQALVSLYLPDSNRKYELNLRLADGGIQVDMDADNRALSDCNAMIYTVGRAFWENAKSMKPEELLLCLKRYGEAVDSIVLSSQCSAPVAEFMRIWVAGVAYNDYSSIPRVTDFKLASLPFSVTDFISNPVELLDKPLAGSFPSTSQIINYFMPKGSLSERMAYLHEHYSCREVQKMVERSMIDSFIRRFDFSNHYESGLEELTSLTEKYGLDKSLIDDFKLRKASAKGSAFPDVVLTDADGNKMDFSSFKGYYVYVDMWASWCGPCCKEAPYLIQLEKELVNKDVKFVSISIDKNAASWKKKMQELGLHGYQLLNQDNQLGEALNVSGIPFFLIYDKEGKLYKYDAPRPSNAKLKELLESLH